MNRWMIVALTAVLAIGVGMPRARAEEDKAKNPTFEKLKALAGTWVKEGKPDIQTEFKVIAGGSAVVETMFPGTKYEMVNVYHPDGDRLLVTHYCAQGVQPRMKLVSSDNGVFKFEFVDSTNLKSRDDPHMDSVTLTITDNSLTEDWAYYQDGKVGEHTKFEMKRKV